MNQHTLDTKTPCAQSLCWLFSLAKLAEQNKWAPADKGCANWSNGLTFPLWQQRIYNLTHRHTHTQTQLFTIMNSGTAVRPDRRGGGAESVKPSRALARLKWWCLNTTHSVRPNTCTETTNCTHTTVHISHKLAGEDEPEDEEEEREEALFAY